MPGFVRRLEPIFLRPDRRGGLSADVLFWMGTASRALDAVDPGPMRARVDEHGHVTPRGPRRRTAIVVATGWGRPASSGR